MCIVIDMNTLASVFNPSSSDHAQFQPVLEWIQEGRGKIVYGGSHYKEELNRSGRYRRVIIELKSKRKVAEIEQLAVDERERQLGEKILEKDCDDRHIIAILCVSGCKLVCSNDKRSYRFIKDKSNYEGKRRVPSIYCKRRNKTLLSDLNIVALRNLA
jgi:hypothetical protein